MTPEIVERNEFIVVGVRAVFEPGVGNTADIWTEQFLPRRNELKDVGAEYYSVFNPLPNDQKGRYEFVAGMLTDSLETIPTGMVGWVVPSGNYAVARAAGLGEVFDVCRGIITDWIPDSGYKRVASPMFAWSEDPDPCAETSLWRVNVPIETPEMLAQLETWFA